VKGRREATHRKTVDLRHNNILAKPKKISSSGMTPKEMALDGRWRTNKPLTREDLPERMDFVARYSLSAYKEVSDRSQIDQ